MKQTTESNGVVHTSDICSQPPRGVVACSRLQSGSATPRGVACGDCDLDDNLRWSSTCRHIGAYTLAVGCRRCRALQAYCAFCFRLFSSIIIWIPPLEWTLIYLLKEVKKRGCIWNITLKDYHDKIKKRNAREEVCVDWFLAVRRFYWSYCQAHHGVLSM